MGKSVSQGWSARVVSGTQMVPALTQRLGCTCLSLEGNMAGLDLRRSTLPATDPLACLFQVEASGVFPRMRLPESKKPRR